MIKHLLSVFLIFSASVLFFGGSALAQTKKDSKPPAKSGDTKGLSNMPMLDGTPAAAQSDVSGKSSKIKKTYSFLVIVNPADEPAMQLWNSLPSRLPELKIVESQSAPFAHIVVTSNPEVGLFKRAYGAYFTIFTEQDFEAFKQALPCLGEMGAELTLMASKLSEK